MNEIYLFLKRFFASPQAIGSLLPSSEKLGVCMAKRGAYHPRKPLRYLEVGAGSGALTRPLIERMHAGDSIDLVEIDPKFCTTLRKQFGHLPAVTIHEISILDFEGKDYDVLISSLPLNAFRAQMVKEILKKYKSLVKPGGYLSYYEYLGLEKIKQRLLFGKTAEDFKKAQVLKKEFASRYGKETNKIWWNFPPARVVHCKIDHAKAPEASERAPNAACVL